ncbi:hypothetical protein M011DRAFT_477865 [Sporormia fimetaria CBS 119925]|uniref:BTB domain-containing protein n=1 Tax=Sporormia fimetaria CBS 119925 TaxID=1340428 RepID=A0A6A6V7N8_9PLEO|nr:hypothetical protein M011DRAFT_477865 [Sporormia fimetaria CBS 119925]
MPSSAFKTLQAARAAKAVEHASKDTSSSAIATVSSEINNASSENNNGQELPRLTLTGILNMSPVERKALDRGNVVTVKSDSYDISHISSELLKAVSSNFTAIVDTNNTIRIPEGIHTGSICSLIDWVDKSTQRNKLTPPRTRKNLKDAINMANTAEFLGMQSFIEETLRFHKKHTFWTGRADLTTNVFVLCHEVDEQAVNVNNPLLRLLAQRVAYVIRRTHVIDPVYGDSTVDEWISMLEQTPKILSIVEEINEPWYERRNAHVVEAEHRAELYKQRETARLQGEAKAAQAQGTRVKAGERQKQMRVTEEVRQGLLEKTKAKIVTLTKEKCEMVRGLQMRGDSAFFMVSV